MQLAMVTGQRRLIIGGLNPERHTLFSSQQTQRSVRKTLMTSCIEGKKDDALQFMVRIWKLESAKSKQDTVRR